MYDKIIGQGFDLPGNIQTLPSGKSKILDELKYCEIICSDNVSHYFYEVDDKNEWNLEKDFPNLAPPFERCWIEYRIPGKINADRHILTRSNDLERVGILVLAQPMIYPEYENETGWLLTLLAFVENKNVPIIGPVFEAKLCVYHDGQFRRFTKEQCFPIVIPAAGNLSQSEADTLHLTGIITLAYPALLTFCFLHCKNVEVIQNYPPFKLSHSNQKRHGRPLVRFKTLNIQPIKAVLKKEGQSETSGLKRALHICRGHFKNYSKHGLFGKTKGTFWWNAQARGSMDEGVVIKDYNVKRPGIIDNRSGS